MRRYALTTLAAGTLACSESSLPSESSDGTRAYPDMPSAVVSFQVNSTTDAVDAAPGNGVCRTTAGACTLRAAIQESNALPGANRIDLPAGTYALTILPSPGKDDASGSIAITGPLQLLGAGAGTTIVDGIALRDAGRTQVIFKLAANAGNVTLSNLTLLNGGHANFVCGGGNLRIEAGVTAVLRKVHVRRGWSYCSAGGIRNDGTLTLDKSIVTGSASASSGGGIVNTGILRIQRSTISDNWAEDDTGGILNSGQLTMINSTVSGNNSAFGAAGLTNTGTAILKNVTVARNGFDGGGTALVSVGTTTISNTLIGGNFGPDCQGSLDSRGYNLITGIAGCTVTGTETGNVIGLLPNITSLQNNGGPTPTHALHSGSPARNAGNPTVPGSSAFACPTGDQRLRPRGATRCDIGSVEMQ
jgi:large repetitive protein